MTSQIISPARTGTRGRPSKRDAHLLRLRIQEAALAEFRQRGYAGSSIDGIARAASVSRTTIYSLYTDKQTLFNEMIRNSIQVTGLNRRVVFDDRSPAIVLHEVMRGLNKAWYREPNWEIIRLCVAEADRFPALIAEVHKMLSSTLVGLTAYFDRLQEQAVMPRLDSECAARLLSMLSLGSLKPFFVHQRRLGQAEIDAHLGLALQIFLAGCFSGALAGPVSADA